MSAFLHYVDDDATPESIRAQLSKSPLTLVIASASFAPKSKALLRDIKTLEKDYDSGSCCGPSPTKPNILVIQTDASEELEELAIELGLKDVPSYQIYKSGSVVGASSSPSSVTVDAIRDQLKSASATTASGCCPPGSSAAARCCPPPSSSAAAASSSSCCPPSSNTAGAAVACCPDGSSTATAPSDPSEVLRLVQQSYANTVNQSGGEGGCCVSVDPEALGYTPVCECYAIIQD
eukprot:CAMPEP_0201607988 /NCGR_PEP_ID=MMETSP0492-20130828/6905_1 /ASSEMBLY_ACC=CAM_ASM_000837 /TAXON_ID=420259 /ORGANISM="Thalassiosira gravida, Strain GMp14c1" /LENGTH=234 /DNA_ID=CAMNT_0048072675 /DNA_START=200 /DNA_END=904 /DNA_ORIENTATION=-